MIVLSCLQPRYCLIQQTANSDLPVFIRILLSSECQNCTLDSALWGTWTSTNLGTVTISETSPSLTSTKTFFGQSVTQNEFDCSFISDSKYVLQYVVMFQHLFENVCPTYVCFFRSCACVQVSRFLVLYTQLYKCIHVPVCVAHRLQEIFERKQKLFVKVVHTLGLQLIKMLHCLLQVMYLKEYTD